MPPIEYGFFYLPAAHALGERASVLGWFLDLIRKICLYVTAFFLDIGHNLFVFLHGPPLLPIEELYNRLSSLNQKILKERLQAALMQAGVRSPPKGIQEVWAKIEEIRSGRKWEKFLVSFYVDWDESSFQELRSFFAFAKFPTLILRAGTLVMTREIFQALDYPELRCLAFKSIGKFDLSVFPDTAQNSRLYVIDSRPIPMDYIEYQGKMGQEALSLYRQEKQNAPQIEVQLINDSWKPLLS